MYLGLEETKWSKAMGTSLLWTKSTLPSVCGKLEKNIGE